MTPAGTAAGRRHLPETKMDKSRITGLLKYLGSLTLALGFIILCGMLLVEMPGGVPQAQANTVTTLKRAVTAKPLPQLNASAFDISRSVKVVVTGKSEPQTVAVTPSAPATPSADPLTQGRTATVVADAVNLRAAPTKGSARVDVVGTGTVVSVLKSERGWSLVVTDTGVEAWLATKFLAN
jgi:hypothetical protein